MRAAQLAAVVTTLVRHGPGLPALAEHVVGGDPGEIVLVDRAGPMTRGELARAVADARPSGMPGLRRIHGHHDRSTVVSLLASSAAGWDVMVTPPGHTGPESQPWRAASRLWLGTSGTTGAPRPTARRRYGAGLIRPVRHLWRSWRLGTPGSILVQPALHHGYGLGVALAGLVARRAVLLPGGRNDLISMINTHRPAMTVSVPVQLDHLPRIDHWRPSIMITGSGPLSPQVQARTIDSFGPVLHNLFGSTEAGFSTMATPEDLARSPGSVGRPLPGVRLRLVDGRVEVRSPFATHTTGWVATGDRGHLDAHGLLMLDGRIDTAVVVNGVNVEPAHVSTLLGQHPAVASAAVEAVPDEVAGHRLTATVRLRTPATAAELTEWLRDRGVPRTRVMISSSLVSRRAAPSVEW